MNRSLFVFVGFVTIALAGMPLLCQAQYGYSKKDLARIKFYRQQFADGDMSRYTIGRFFERIYDNYRDTSMNAAISAYTSIANIEGPENSKESKQAAFRLGEIYSKAKGAPRNIDHALAYYFISGDFGKNRFDAVKKRFAGRDSIVYASESRDSLVIGYHPLLGLKNGRTLAAIREMVNSIPEHPEMQLRITLEKPGTFYSAIYSYWITTQAPVMLTAFLGQKFDFPEDRIEVLNNKAFVVGPEGYRVTLTLGVNR